MSHTAVLVIFLTTIQPSIGIEMRDRQNKDPAGSDLIDVFQIIANSSNCNKAIYLGGDLEIASILFKYEISCTNVSACDLPTNTSMAACSKISETPMQIFV